MMSKPRVIAFYLPQFYPTPENDKWWEPGFTEWSNVTRAKPLYKGHFQPRLPRDLGFYDLRVPEVREKQAKMAKEAGIEGFCYWHYWFGNGKRLLSEVFEDVVSSGKPDFPFCLCWANHSWYNKIWIPNMPDKLLMEQTYPGEDDFVNHFKSMLPAFQDPRYIRVNGKLLFGVFEPWTLDIVKFSSVWNSLAEEYGLGGFHFFDFSYGTKNYNRINHGLYDSCVLDVMFDAFETKPSLSFRIAHRINKGVVLKNVSSYDTYVNKSLEIFKQLPCTYPCIVPGFDHSPRSGGRGHILYDSTPNKWGNLCKSVIELLSHRPEEENLLFIKAWNEWGEGNYLEPDLRFGHQYLDELAKSLDK